MTAPYYCDDEVKPTPSVSEVSPETESDPLQEHLQHEQVNERLVCVAQRRLKIRPIVEVDVLKHLFIKKTFQSPED